MQPVITTKHRSISVKQLVADVTDKINSGELKPGDYLPSAKSLASDYGIGYASVIRAYKTLSEASMIETVQGRGAFVRGEGANVKVDEITVCLPSPQLISQSDNPHSDWVFQNLLAAMNAATLARGVRLHLLFMQEVAEQFAAVIDSLSKSSGVIFVLEAPPAWVLRLERRSIPYALILPVCQRDWESELPTVYPDYNGSVYSATSELLQMGCKSPMYLGCTLSGYEMPRYLGFSKAVSDAGLAEQGIECSEIGEDAGYRAMEDHLAADKVSFDLLVAGNDLRAIGAMKCLIRHGVRIPQDLSVLGFDDIPASGEMNLSTIRLPIREMGEECVYWFLDTVAGNRKANPPKFVVPCPFIKRKSTR